MISASAIGYYGDRGDEVVREDSPSGAGFLPEVCRQWEAATKAAADAGIRTIQIRIGIGLSAQGGALKKMLPPFRMGFGATTGNGRQWMSWIHVQDLVGAILHILDNHLDRRPCELSCAGASQEFGLHSDISGGIVASRHTSPARFCQCD